ncbi:unannotated protein [freshwater metagenome]|uniref:Unannotated protein n=1 Tax=freshwater metagenome TaxID=449393 RepID=A0A6J6PTF7_9ZZZZ
MPTRCLLALSDDFFNLLAYRLQGDTQAFEGFGCDAFALVDQAEQNVLGADVVVVQHSGFFLSKHDYPPRPVGKPLEHRSHSICLNVHQSATNCSGLHGNRRSLTHHVEYNVLL